MAKARDCRALVEQMNRQIARLTVLPPGKVFPYHVNLWQLGDALWIIVPGELYQTFQLTLRQRFPTRPIIVATVCGDWQPGYLPPASGYGYGIYQEVIAAVGAGAQEMLIEAIARIAAMDSPHATALFEPPNPPTSPPEYKGLSHYLFFAGRVWM